MATKPLPPRDLVRQLLDYDPATGEFTWLPRPREMFANCRAKAHAYESWNAKFAGKAAGGFKKHGYLYIFIASHKRLAHRLAWLIVYGEPVPNGIDHTNGNSRDNRITNLRAASQSQNIANARIQRNTATGYKGIEIANQRNGFCVRIQFRGKRSYIGTFATIEEAAEARRSAAARLHGEFARD